MVISIDDILMTTFHIKAKFSCRNCSIDRGENEGKVTVASTASEYPLADF